MLKKVALYDLLVGILGAVLTQVVFKHYALIFFLGLTMASLSFIVSGYAAESAFLHKTKRFGAIVSFINVGKVLIICIIGMLIFNNSINNVIAFILGFTSHFIALIL
jgi:ATP synthase protein I